LVWDGEALGLCVRVYGDGSKSFLFVYRIDDRQRFIRIGKTLVWSLDAARKRAKELRAVLIEQDRDPANYHREADRVKNVIRYIATHLAVTRHALALICGRRPSDPALSPPQRARGNLNSRMVQHSIRVNDRWRIR
jgi:hypothetical protein